MSTHTKWEWAADALQQAFLVNLIANFEAEAWDLDPDSDSSDSSYSNSSSHSSSFSSSSGSDDEPTPAKCYVDAMAELYSEWYLNEHWKIDKSHILLQLLLDNYKYSCPEIFCSYLWINPDCFDNLVTTTQQWGLPQ